MINYQFLSDSRVIVSTKYRVKVVNFEVANAIFELSKLYILKRIYNKKLFERVINDLLDNK